MDEELSSCGLHFAVLFTNLSLEQAKLYEGAVIRIVKKGALPFLVIIHVSFNRRRRK